MSAQASRLSSHSFLSQHRESRKHSSGISLSSSSSESGMETASKILYWGGPACTKSKEALSGVLKADAIYSDAELAACLRIIARSGEWNGQVTGAVLAERYSAPNWAAVVEALDQDGLAVPEAAGLVNMLEVFAAYQAGAAVQQLVGRPWKNVGAQTAIFTHIVGLGRDRFDLGSFGLAKVVTAADVAEADSSVQAQAAALEGHALNSRDVVRGLIELVQRKESGMEGKVLLDQAAKAAPALVLLGAVDLPTPWSSLQHDIITMLLDLFLLGHASHQLVFYRLWHHNEAFLGIYFTRAHLRDNSKIGRIATIAHELGALPKLVRAKPHFFVLDLFAYAAQHGWHPLQAVLDECKKDDEAQFAKDLLEFLDVKSAAEYAQQQQQQNMDVYADVKANVTPLHVGVVYELLHFLMTTQMSPEFIEQFKAVQTRCVQTYPRLINYGQGHDATILQNSATNVFSPEIEKKMKFYYQQMYEKETSISEVISFLQRLRTSEEPDDQDIFACMVHSLFDEYRFFPDYPLNALATTAVLFGSIIQFHLIEDIPLSVALRFVLEALKEPPDAKMFKFGLQALLQFQSRLESFPQYCSLLLQIPTLDAVQPQLMAKLRAIIARSTGADDAGEPAEPPADEDKLLVPEPFTCLHLDPMTLGDQRSEDPAEDVRDKVLFIVNNLAPGNVRPKSLELRDILEERYHQWFASYLVENRAKQEPNYHALYVELLDHVASAHLNRQILHSTYNSIIGALNSQSTISSSTDRSRLKNLGNWLGVLTLARDKPIKHRNISFKDLLIEGFESNRLIVVLPFTCKVLEQSAKSRIFRPPNPWLMGILRLMVELYQFAELKLNLKFEIEVLCKNLSLEIKDLEPSTTVRDRPLRDKLSEPAPTIVLSPELESLIAGYPNLKKILQTAADKALGDLMSAVVDRSDTICQIATRELVTKDFSLEGDEGKMRKAAHNMAKFLAGSLAVVTCKEPFRQNIASSLKSLLLAHGYTEQSIPSDLIAAAMYELVEYGCARIEKGAVEKTLEDVDATLAPAFAARRKYREMRTGQPFIDPHTSRLSLALPDPFKLKPGGLTLQQLMIYDELGRQKFAGVPPELLASEFADYGALGAHGQPLSQAASLGLQSPTAGATDRFGSFAQLSQSELLLQQAGQLGLGPALDGHGPAPAGLQAQQDLLRGPPSKMATQAILDQMSTQMQAAVDAVLKMVKDLPNVAFSQLPENHQLRVTLVQMLNVVMRHPLAEQLTLRTAQIAMNALVTLSDSQLARDALASLLLRLCDLSPATAKEVVLWLLHSDDDRKYNAPVMLTLIRRGLIDVQDLDLALSKQVAARRRPAVDFAAEIIREAVLSDEPLALETDFAACIQAMEMLSAATPPDAVAKGLLEAFEAFETMVARAAEGDAEAKLRQQMKHIFNEWTRLVQHPAQDEKMLFVFVYQMASHGILDDTRRLSLFLRLALEECMADFAKAQAQFAPQDGQAYSTPKAAYVAIDSLAKLVVLLVKVHEDSAEAGKIKYLQGILGIVCLVFASEHEAEAEAFNGQPFFRFFSSVLCEWSAIEDSHGPYREGFYVLFADILKALQPVAFPGFTFAWMTLISHRFFMPKILNLDDKRGWPHFVELLEALLKFIGYDLVKSDVPDSVRFIYRGTLRIVLVLLHDFPKFLAEYHYPLCNVLPASCIQLRNLILSAFPQNMSLPDPFAHGFKVERLPEIRQAPAIAQDPAVDLQYYGLKQFVDAYAKAPDTAAISLKPVVAELKIDERQELGLGFSTVSMNVAAMNALVLYLGMESIAEAKTNTPESLTFNTNSGYLKFLTSLLLELDAEGRYFLLSAVANQLRYPNSHTHHFSCVLLYLFGFAPLDSQKLDIQQQITRVLLERLICHRPHPWGLLITFTELLKNNTYNF
ncbi:CCR4-NOT core subunit CDC39, partial [Dipodascopsis tothii]|uniref:CCR4-NOT core subunit CDC39 n=1 Tax=Dipodascopsis tothii TaxID=44089 RepID=UPI0034CEE5BB